ncbi:MAG: TetR/AcrR family transcriptional regulator [Moraxellaceae bacterium]
MIASAPGATANRPSQQRARDRFDSILLEAEHMLVESGLSGFSIPLLAERLGYTRGSVYAYFPTPYALFNELMAGYLLDMEKLLRDELRRMPPGGWDVVATHLVRVTADFYNQHPVAPLLLLGGAVTDSSYRVQEMCIKHMADMARTLFERAGMQLPQDPDVIVLTVDIGTACLRRSFFEHGRITPAYCEIATTAMTGFLGPYLRSQTGA